MIPVSLIDYTKCHEYARSQCGQFGIPLCDAEDIGSDAFLLSIRRSWRTGGVENDIAAANRLMYTSVLNVIARRNTRANRIIREADEIDGARGASTLPDGDPTDDEVVDNSIVDAGRACRSATAAIPDADDGRACRSATADPYADWQNPFWLRLFNSERQKLRNEKKKLELRIIKAGLKDSRLSIVWGSMHISWGQFQTILKIFRERFALCFQALRAWRSEM